MSRKRRSAPASAGLSALERSTPEGTGTYTILVDPSDAGTGNLTLNLYNVPPDTSQTISPGSSAVASNSVPGQNAKLVFTGSTSERVSLSVSNNTMGTLYVSILNPDGSALVSRYGIYGGSGYIDTQGLPSDGTYTVLLDPSGNATGSATVSLYDVPADVTGTITPGGPGVPVTITTPGQNARLTFSGNQGQQLSVQTSANSIYSSRISVLKPDGTSLTSGTAYSYSNANISVPALPSTGTYTIVVDPNSSYRGSMTLTLSVSGSASTTTVQGPTILTSLALPSTDLWSLHRPALALHKAKRARGPERKRAHKKAHTSRLAALERVLRRQQGNLPSVWHPQRTNMRGDWRMYAPDSPWSQLPARHASAGVTALSGQVLEISGRPIAGVTVSIRDRGARTDSTGRFLLSSIPSGHLTLVVDGNGAGRYGEYEIGVDVRQGATTILPFTIWLTKLDTAHEVGIPSPSTRDVSVTTPYIPGLELRIPKGSVVRDSRGRVVRRIGITPVPVDRPPFPLPEGVWVPVYFTVQPGRAYIFPKGAQLIYPNYTHEAPGTRENFWSYEPDEGWHVYGHGTVSRDGRQVVPDPDTRVYKLTGAMINVGGLNPPSVAPAPGGTVADGDPVDLGTGLFVMNKTDLYLPGVMPISLTRTYRPNDSAVRAFGVGTNWTYGMFLWSAQQYQQADLVLPDGGKVHYVRTSPGTGFLDAVFESTYTPTAFYGSVIRWNGQGWNLTLKDGTVYVFGENAPLQAIRDRFGNQVTVVHASGQSGNITAIRSSDGRWIELTYDFSNRLTQAQDNTGRTVKYTYDSSGRLSSVTDPAGGVTTYTYDSSNRMTSIKDPKGLVYLANEYDSNGRVIKQTQADGTTYQFAYTLDSNGNVTRTDVTDPRGKVRRTEFNSDGYPVSDTYALGTSDEQVVTYERQTGSDLVTSVTDPLGRKTSYTYDSKGNVTEVTYLAGTGQAVKEEFTYDPKYGELTSSTDELGHVTSYGYDPKGELVSVTDPLGHKITAQYNAQGQPVTITDPLGHDTSFSYELGDLVSTTDPLGRTLTRFVDGAGRLVSVTNQYGEQLRYAYDPLNQPTQVTDPLGEKTKYTYDPNGNLTSLTDKRGDTTTYTYDYMDRPTKVTDPLNRSETYEYDAMGDLVKVTDAKGQVTTAEYDELGRLIKTTFDDGSTTSYTYDAADRLTRVEDSRSGTITETYDPLDRLTSETTPQGKVSYAYDEAGRRTSMTVEGQPSVSYSYDDSDRLTEVDQGQSKVSLAYDSNDRPTSVTLPNGVVMGYSYDAANELTGITYSQGSSRLGDIAYSYDDAGRLAGTSGSYSRTGLPQAVDSATYDAANELTRWGDKSLTYDADGNLTSDGTNAYTWDARGDLSSVSGNTAASFSYDAFGRRASKTVGGQSTDYLYDGDTPVQELAGAQPVANLLTGLSGEVYSRTDSSGTYTLLPDARGSTVALSDPGGTVRTEYTYDPFGNVTSSGEANDNPYQYLGEQNDGTGLYYGPDGYYNPELQQPPSADDGNPDPGEINNLLSLAGRKVGFSDCGQLEGMTCGMTIQDESGGFGGKVEPPVEAPVPEGNPVNPIRWLQRLVQRLFGGGTECSFSADTEVATDKGEKPISEIKVGDKVLAYDQQTGKEGYYRVKAVLVHKDRVIEHLTVAGEQIETTPEHPFYTEERGWVPAGELKAGIHVRKADGSYGVVEGVAFERHIQRMYNLTVDGAHTFFVGEQQLLVHNWCVNWASANNARTAAWKGQAPRSIERIDTRREQRMPEAHFTDGSALYQDGTWKHGYHVLTNRERAWLRRYGWRV